MFTGGYQIVSFGGKNITSADSPTVQLDTAPYGLIEGTRKPIMLTDVVIDNTAYHGAFIQPYVSGTSYVFDFADFTVTLTDENKVSVKEIENA